MTITFYKFHGTGNDFVILDNRNLFFTRGMTDIYRFLCDRHFGIGADGLMLFQNAAGFDFEMVYFNADGKESSMCGNGGRCMVEFARLMGMKKDAFTFIAVDGEHEAIMDQDNIRLKMSDVNSASRLLNHYIVETGSPHYVAFVDKVDSISVKKEGAEIRYSEKYRPDGINVNFVQKFANGLKIRTYERGVEDETFSCGTGVTAAALMYSVESEMEIGLHSVDVETLGGTLQVNFQKISDSIFSDVWLTGPAKFVFKGEIEIPG